MAQTSSVHFFGRSCSRLGIWHAFCMAILLGSLSTGAPASEVASRRQPSTFNIVAVVGHAAANARMRLGVRRQRVWHKVLLRAGVQLEFLQRHGVLEVLRRHLHGVSELHDGVRRHHLPRRHRVRHNLHGASEVHGTSERGREGQHVSKDEGEASGRARTGWQPKQRYLLP